MFFKHRKIKNMYNSFKCLCIERANELCSYPELIIPDIKRIIDDTYIKYSDRIYTMNMDYNSYILVGNGIIKLLASGRYHIGIGCLSLSGEMLRKDYTHIIDIVYDKNYISSNERDELKKNLYDTIKSL